MLPLGRSTVPKEEVADPESNLTTGVGPISTARSESEGQGLNLGTPTRWTWAARHRLPWASRALCRAKANFGFPRGTTSSTKLFETLVP